MRSRKIDRFKTTEFVVWKLARGALTRETDSFLSPYIPVVEDEYE
ncbi:Imm7 family immunity protein [Paenibacillus sp. Soil522]|nr:Imm7 family immunity protein [Paenibacillus sp. Soil522]